MFDANQVAAIESAMEEEHRKDREALQRLKRFLPSNGSNGRVPMIVIDRSEDSEINYANAVETGDPLTIIDKVEEIMQGDPNKKWTVPAMVAYLQQINFPLVAKKPQATMGLVFGKLARTRKTIVRVRKGSGRNPHTYRAIPRAHQEDASESSTNERAAS